MVASSRVTSRVNETRVVAPSGSTETGGASVIVVITEKRAHVKTRQAHMMMFVKFVIM